MTRASDGLVGVAHLIRIALLPFSISTLALFEAKTIICWWVNDATGSDSIRL
jgi:hypothetical protein